MRIVTWNVYWLQGSGYADWRPGGPRDDVLAGAARLLIELGGDLACLQELQSFEAARALAAAARMAWWLYRPGGSPERPQYGGAILARDETFSFAPVADERIERFAIKAVRPADGACLANVHLRSNRFESIESAAAARGDELAAVLDGEPRPQVVAGDFNAALDAALWDVLRRRGFFDAAERAGCRDAPTTLGAGRGDRIWVHQDLADRFVAAEVLGGERTVLAPRSGILPERGLISPGSTEGRAGDAGDEHLSDHLPVVVELAL